MFKYSFIRNGFGFLNFWPYNFWRTPWQFQKQIIYNNTYLRLHCWPTLIEMFTFAVCNFIIHERCVTSVVTPCSGVAPCIIKVRTQLNSILGVTVAKSLTLNWQNPVAHCWSEPTHHKRKFCTVCRKRLDEAPAVHCLGRL